MVKEQCGFFFLALYKSRHRALERTIADEMISLCFRLAVWLWMRPSAFRWRSAFGRHAPCSYMWAEARRGSNAGGGLRSANSRHQSKWTNNTTSASPRWSDGLQSLQLYGACQYINTTVAVLICLSPVPSHVHWRCYDYQIKRSINVCCYFF